MTAITSKVRIKDSHGLHARSSAVFVHTASRFNSDISVERNGSIVDGKSIIGLLTLAAGKGSIIKISADGADSELAITSLSKLFEEDNNFSKI